MATTLSLSRLWTIYKRTAVTRDLSKREMASIQLAFYSGARGVLKVLAYLIEHGDSEELHETIKRLAAPPMRAFSTFAISSIDITSPDTAMNRSPFAAGSVIARRCRSATSRTSTTPKYNFGHPRPPRIKRFTISRDDECADSRHASLAVWTDV
jgi:hypothetical protein